MPRRERTSGRRPPRREPLLRLLIVCGAEKTEREYFKGLRGWLATASVDIKILEHSRAPDQVVEHARDHCDYRDFDSTWCVVDVDEFEVQGRKITAACTMAGRADIQLAISNPCFEYWLLLHHAASGAPSYRCESVVDQLRKIVTSYDKAKLRFSDFQDGVILAVQRAKQRDPTGKDHTANPSSSAWVLVQTLLDQRKRNE